MMNYRAHFGLGFLGVCVFAASLCGTCAGSELPNHRMRGAFFGMFAAAPEVSLDQDPQGMRTLAEHALQTADSLVREGGFDPEVVSQIELADRGKNRTDHAFQRLILPSGANTMLCGLVDAIPLALAYVCRPGHGMRAAGVAAALDHGGMTEWRGAGRAYCAALLCCLRKGNLSRRTILHEAAQAAACQEIQDAVRRVRTVRNVDGISLRPADVITHILRAWYDSRSYEDALQRLGPDASPARRMLVGALVGAEGGSVAIPRDRWDSLRANECLEPAFERLLDLARDGVLLPVSNEMPIPDRALNNQAANPARSMNPNSETAPVVQKHARQTPAPRPRLNPSEALAQSRRQTVDGKSPDSSASQESMIRARDVPLFHSFKPTGISPASHPPSARESDSKPPSSAPSWW
jgi:hypothetical protein